MKLNQMIEAAKTAREIRKKRDDLGVNPAQLMQNPMAAMGKLSEIGEAVQLSTELEGVLLGMASDHEKLIVSAKSVVEGKDPAVAFAWLTEEA